MAIPTATVSRPSIGSAGRPLVQASRGVRTYAGGLALACLLIFASRVVWYDLRIILPEVRGNLRLLFAAYSVCLVPFVGLAYFGALRHVVMSKLMLLLHLVIIYGVVLAIVFGSIDHGYFVTDIFKLMFVPTAFVLFCARPPVRLERFLERLAQAILIYQVLRVGVFLTLAPGVLYYGGVTDMFPLCYYLNCFMQRQRKNELKGIAGVVSALALIVLGQKRTLLVASVAVICYASFRNRKSVSQRISVYLFFAGVIIAGSYLAKYIETLADFGFFTRVATTEFDTALEGESSRQREVRDVFTTLEDSGAWAFVLGHGHGATFEREDPDPLTGEVILHSVHFTPAAMHLRYGILGWVFYLSLCVAVMFAKESVFPPFASSKDILIMKTYGLAAIMCSITMYGLVDDMIIGAFLAAMVLSRRAHVVALKRRLRSRTVIPHAAKSSTA
jgi:hypothetical protein